MIQTVPLGTNVVRGPPEMTARVATSRGEDECLGREDVLGKAQDGGERHDGGSYHGPGLLADWVHGEGRASVPSGTAATRASGPRRQAR